MTFLHGGLPVAPDEILARREQRADQLDELSDRYPDLTLICLKLNIPGCIKQSPVLDRLFDRALDELKEALPQVQLLALIRLTTGPEAFIGAALPPDEVKRAMVLLEENSAAGRLYDIDVMHAGRALSREQLGLTERRCLICALPARLCVRSQAHPLPEVLLAVEVLLKADPSLVRLMEESAERPV